MPASHLGQLILLGRLLTRSGDQAWDFAVPFAFLTVFPGEISIAAFYYFLVRLFVVVLLPRLTAVIDRVSRFRAAKIGISVQFLGVLLGALSIWMLWQVRQTESIRSLGVSGVFFLVAVFSGILSNLGSVFMDISIANDLVPSAFNERDLPRFNSRLRQVDLFTEVTSPLVAGALFMLDSPKVPLLGFFLIAVWNLLSFFPEYAILGSIFRGRPDLGEKEIVVDSSRQMSFLRKFTLGWRTFFQAPVALAVLAYSLLWLSVLSPHGVLMAAFLKDGWKLPEWAIGAFRGFGAVFGLVATIIFPAIVKRFGLIRGTHSFLLLQAVALLAGILCFWAGETRSMQIAFLLFILVSRIGLYGFSLGETQIRQIGLAPQSRGEMNGFASALTGLATLLLYGLGALLPSTEDFRILVVASVICVWLGTAVFTFWSIKERKQGN